MEPDLFEPQSVEMYMVNAWVRDPEGHHVDCDGVPCFPGEVQSVMEWFTHEMGQTGGVVSFTINSI